MEWRRDPSGGLLLDRQPLADIHTLAERERSRWAHIEKRALREGPTALLPNDTHVAGATTFATHLISGKEYPVGIEADATGHVKGSLPAWGLWIPAAATAASRLWFDLFNAQASTVVRLRKLFAVPTLAVVTGTFGIQLDVSRTTAVGTAGTAAVSESTTVATAATFWRFDTTQAALPAGITARVAPTGGATTGAFLFSAYITTEESNAAGGLIAMYDLLPEIAHQQPVELQNGQGIKVVEASTATPIGTLGFLVVFTIE